MKLLHPQYWSDYELIDSGGYEKLERFGKYILCRPEPQAIWNKSLSEMEWKKSAHATFRREKEKQISDGNDRGEWLLKPSMPQQWLIHYRYKQMHLRFRLGLTSFKHVGIFPEQAENWNFIYDTITDMNVEETPKILNLFAYTGGASLAAKSAGADVTHVDSVRQVIAWSRENMELSGLKDIRWVIEDALKYVGREVRRGNFFHGIILDPPAYGRGPKGEKWILEEHIAGLMQACSRLLYPSGSFLVLNLYAMGFSALVANNLIKSYFPYVKEPEFGELCISDSSAKSLPLSVFCRFLK
jgi:23S rRNA (cytosine1962-C5)-methyltransferase